MPIYQDHWECLTCGKKWSIEPTWKYLPTWIPGTHHYDKGTIVKRPAAVQGTAGRATRTTSSSGVVINQVGPKLFTIQGTAAKPYVIDLEGRDDRVAGPTRTCTCVNWKTTRNRLVGQPGGFTGYDCKHITEVLKTVKTDGGVRKGKQIIEPVSESRSKALQAEIMATFVRPKNA